MRTPMNQIKRVARAGATAYERDYFRAPSTATRWVNATMVGLLTAALAYIIGLGGNYDPLILSDADLALIAGLTGAAFEFFRHRLKRAVHRASPQRVAGELALICAVALAVIALRALVIG